MTLSALKNYPKPPCVSPVAEEIKTLESELDFFMKRAKSADEQTLNLLQPRANKLKSDLLTLASKWGNLMPYLLTDAAHQSKVPVEINK